MTTRNIRNRILLGALAVFLAANAIAWTVSGSAADERGELASDASSATEDAWGTDHEELLREARARLGLGDGSLPALSPAAPNPVVPDGQLGEFRHGTWPSLGVGDGNWTHAGVDIRAPCGSRVVAFADGTVVDRVAARGEPGFDALGHMILIEHPPSLLGRTFHTLYLHLQDTPRVAVGDRVEGGRTAIGRVGATGTDLGCHLHFEARFFAGRFHPEWDDIHGRGDRRATNELSRNWIDPLLLFRAFPEGLHEPTAIAAAPDATPRETTAAASDESTHSAAGAEMEAVEQTLRGQLEAAPPAELPLAAAEPEPMPAPASGEVFDIVMQDGSAFSGHIAAESVAFVTSFGTLRLRTDQLVALRDGELRLSDGSTLRGVFADAVVRVAIAAGEVELPLAQVRSLSRQGEASDPEAPLDLGPTPAGVDLTSTDPLVTVAADLLPPAFDGLWVQGSCENPARVRLLNAFAVADFLDIGGRQHLQIMLVENAAAQTIDHASARLVGPGTGLSQQLDMAIDDGRLDGTWIRCQAVPPILQWGFGEGIAVLAAMGDIRRACAGAGGAACLRAFWNYIDVSGDGKVSKAELARAFRGFGFLAAYAMQQQGLVASEDLVVPVTIAAILGQWLAGRIVEGSDYDGDGMLSVEEVFQDRGDLASVMAAIQQLGPDAAVAGVDQASAVLRPLLEGAVQILAMFR